MEDDSTILVLVRDLIFASRITTTAKSVNASVRLIRDPASLGSQPALRLIVDLNLAGAIDAARRWKEVTSGDVVGFVSHLDTETINQGRSAGIDRVLARSRFVELLPELLKLETKR